MILLMTGKFILIMAVVLLLTLFVSLLVIMGLLFLPLSMLVGMFGIFVLFLTLAAPVRNSVPVIAAGSIFLIIERVMKSE